MVITGPSGARVGRIVKFSDFYWACTLPYRGIPSFWVQFFKRRRGASNDVGPVGTHDEIGHTKSGLIILLDSRREVHCKGNGCYTTRTKVFKPGLLIIRNSEFRVVLNTKYVRKMI